MCISISILYINISYICIHYYLHIFNMSIALQTSHAHRLQIQAPHRNTCIIIIQVYTRIHIPILQRSVEPLSACLAQPGKFHQCHESQGKEGAGADSNLKAHGPSSLDPPLSATSTLT